MKNDHTSIPLILDLVLPYLQHKAVSPTAIVAYCYLYDIADTAGSGYVSYFEMSWQFGRNKKSCRECLKLLKRNGLVESVHADGRGGAVFKLVLPDATADIPSGRYS